jgi:anthranilate phosphoribosyltransferase
VWLCHNRIGADELVSLVDNTVCPNNRDGDFVVPGDVHHDGESLADLRPADGDPVDGFLAVLSGQAPDAAVRTVCLNAAALGVLSGVYEDWDTARDDAEHTVRSGAAVHLLERLRAAPALRLRAAHA